MCIVVRAAKAQIVRASNRLNLSFEAVDLLISILIGAVGRVRHTPLPKFTNHHAPAFEVSEGVEAAAVVARSRGET